MGGMYIAARHENDRRTFDSLAAFVAWVRTLPAGCYFWQMLNARGMI